jgi:hypothetical protein
MDSNITHYNGANDYRQKKIIQQKNAMNKISADRSSHCEYLTLTLSINVEVLHFILLF